MDQVLVPLGQVKTLYGNIFRDRQLLRIFILSTTASIFTGWLYDYIFDDEESFYIRVKKTFFKYMKKIPSIKAKLDDEILRINNGFRKDVYSKTKHLDYYMQLPEKKMSKEEIMEVTNEYLNLGSYNWQGGRVSGSVYYSNAELVDLIKEVYAKTSYTNPLHPDVFPGICKMEAEVIRMVSDLFHGDENTCGTMTSGGTESIIMACKAYRDYGKEVRGIKKPEMVIPITAHSAFAKASLYLRIKVKYVPVDPITTKVDIKAMRKAISGNTIMLLGSAPNFPYGTMDDIESISELGVRYNVPVHVDSCLGGFLTIFMDEAGYPIPTCDFRLPGVMSISADTHKYGFAPKGTSVIMYRKLEYLHHQYTTTVDWPGGVYGSPTVSGSRAGGAIAACWATLLSFGKEGYVAATRDIVHTTKYIEKGLRRIEHIYVFGQPVTSVVAIGSTVFDIYRLQTYLSEKGWNLNILQFPSGIHLGVTHIHTQPGVADAFLNDVQNGVIEVMKDPTAPVIGKMAVYGYAQGIPDRSIVDEVTNCYLDAMYYTPRADDEKLLMLE
ncbi:PREDICTED: sphingosine-1-phosphate lyase [Nicrophorus vespilloides]|uniref:sphinganine-1-phosphate aldolase n=1 Tax=Nicrophorus vespilloides TaxID=110193 RepID=A0ABM1M4F4_NICVS|nr:PREDICTED: sphingosine-1-phosphate lyase [Nicrophorus vespilloides]